MAFRVNLNTMEEEWNHRRIWPLWCGWPPYAWINSLQHAEEFGLISSGYTPWICSWWDVGWSPGRCALGHFLVPYNGGGRKNEGSPGAAGLHPGGPVNGLCAVSQLLTLPLRLAMTELSPNWLCCRLQISTTTPDLHRQLSVYLRLPFTLNYKISVNTISNALWQRNIGVFVTTPEKEILLFWKQTDVDCDIILFKWCWLYRSVLKRFTTLYFYRFLSVFIFTVWVWCLLLSTPVSTYVNKIKVYKSDLVLYWKYRSQVIVLNWCKKMNEGDICDSDIYTQTC